MALFLRQVRDQTPDRAIVTRHHGTNTPHPFRREQIGDTCAARGRIDLRQTPLSRVTRINQVVVATSKVRMILVARDQDVRVATAVIVIGAAKGLPDADDLAILRNQSRGRQLQSGIRRNQRIQIHARSAVLPQEGAGKREEGIKRRQPGVGVRVVARIGHAGDHSRDMGSPPNVVVRYRRIGTYASAWRNAPRGRGGRQGRPLQLGAPRDYFTTVERPQSTSDAWPTT